MNNRSGDIGNSWLRPLAIGLALVVSWVTGASAVACPACKEAAVNQGNGLAEGISFTVLGMIATPWVLLATIGFILYRGYRKRVRAKLPSIEIDQAGSSLTFR